MSKYICQKAPYALSSKYVPITPANCAYIYNKVFLAKLAWSTIIAVIYMYAILQNKYLQNINLCIYTNPKSGLNFSEFLVHIFRIT